MEPLERALPTEVRRHRTFKTFKKSQKPHPVAKKRDKGWGTLGIVMMFVGLRALKRAVMFGPARPLSFRILAD